MNRIYNQKTEYHKCVYCCQDVPEGSGLYKQEFYYVCYKCFKSGKIMAEYEKLKNMKFCIEPSCADNGSIEIDVDNLSAKDINTIIDLSKKMIIFWKQVSKMQLEYGGMHVEYVAEINDTQIVFQYESRFDRYDGYVKREWVNGRRISKAFKLKDVVNWNISEQEKMREQLEIKKMEAKRRMEFLKKLLPNELASYESGKDYSVPTPRGLIWGR